MWASIISAVILGLFRFVPEFMEHRSKMKESKQKYKEEKKKICECVIKDAKDRFAKARENLKKWSSRNQGI